jgi:hypothetical protein
VMMQCNFDTFLCHFTPGLFAACLNVVRGVEFAPSTPKAVLC